VLFRRSTVAVAAVVVIAFAIGFVVYRLTSRQSIDDKSLTAAVGLVAALAGVAAAVATAYAAVAALRAAQESSVAASRATEALGLALEPHSL
jgi:high-affinity Fe2+/Pb2+ permease